MNPNLLIGLGTGAVLAYMLDPNLGRRRRTLARDKMRRAARKTRDGVDATVRDVANRTRGIAAETRARLSDEVVDDARLVERVRAKVGRMASHPRAIDVYAHGGQVTLGGPILAAELDDLLTAVTAVRGVRGVTNQLEPHASSDSVPALQGDGSVPGEPIDILQRHWSPATQALVTVAGLAATGACLAAYARR
jgi:hypothetical protein